MVEFAFSGIGLNPHYGTPGNPADPMRVPGGSSSGAAVAVADGMCEIAIGTDTGGSTRIPAAFCGVVGYKPTKSRVPTEGAFPLSYTLDSVGPIAKSVAACAAADAVMAGDDPWTLEPAPLQGLRLGIPQGLPLRDLDQTVATQFSDATKGLARSGVRLSDEPLPLLDDMVRVNSKATFAVAESYVIHRERLATHAADYDSFVRSRIEGGRALSAADYMAMLRDRTALVRSMDARLSELDALVLPTTPIVAPTIVEVSSSEGFTAKNGLVLRNPAIVNFFDLCAISLPLPRPGGLPVGLMLVARNGHDRRLFRMAAAAERLFGA
jgi:aspartyl-tRNA(Asn)/glutamyl-tRNA(Gln) amidotransferase subunit A